MPALARRDVASSPCRFIVVGGGPVGLVAALSLARQGHGVTVLEADEGICDGSRAICISRRSLQVLARLGVADRFLDKGLPWTEGRSYLGTTEIFHLRMPYDDEDRFPPFVNLQQFHAETFLRAACEDTGLVDIRWGHRVVGIDAHPDGVDLTAEAAGSTMAFRADWVIAADGGRSFVREGLGLTLEGRSYESRYLIADIALDCDWPTERKVWFDPASNPASTVIMHRQPDNVWRIDYQLPAHEDSDEALRDDSVRERIAAHLAMVGLSGPWQLLWKSIYRAHTLSLPNYIHGRIGFAGDAAHLVPIFGVRGLNSGIDDALNLAWKMSLVARGLAPAALLTSYTQERRGAYLENIENATKSTWFMSPPSEGFIVARDAVLELATRHAQFRVLIDPRQSSAHHYRSSAIDPDAEGPWVGLPLPEARLSDGRSLHDLLGSGFGAVLCTTAAATHGVNERTAGGLTLRLVRIPADDKAAARLGMQPGDLFLVRPDGYVASACRNTDDAAVTDALQRVLTRAGLSYVKEHTGDAA